MIFYFVLELEKIEMILIDYAMNQDNFTLSLQMKCMIYLKDCPQALENTLAIAEQCSVEIPMGDYHLPRFPIPKTSGATITDDYLRLLCQQGLVDKYRIITPEIQRRLDYELNVIKDGFVYYFNHYGFCKIC